MSFFPTEPARDRSLYTQVKLTRLDHDGLHHLITWLPAKIAIPGHSLSLKGSKDSWTIHEAFHTGPAPQRVRE
jgi:hypothetical protein